MRRSYMLFAAAWLGLAALAATSPAQAAPFHVIRWDNTGVCQVWDDGLTIKPIRWPSDYKVVSKPIPTFTTALAVKDQLVKRGHCKF
jgi:hypothetical protein